MLTNHLYLLKNAGAWLLLKAFLGILVTNLIIFITLTVLWSLSANQSLVGGVLLDPQYRLNDAALMVSTTDIINGITKALWISAAIVSITGTAWLIIIWLAHLDRPGQMPQLRWQWLSLWGLGAIIDAIVLGYLFFLDIAVLRPAVDMLLWLFFIMLYLIVFFATALLTTPHIARPAVLFGATTLPR